eukprot:TRINITY_DN1735_c0_g2_i2.p1 TRINITY_DN1735_c0_g2~~TRINITY_DN1735_c0_g2_i2.p1  ORF type:complete len:122 (-),score=39.73 TRINITY_DN1735_c0_g2_i2:75-440(-)
MVVYDVSERESFDAVKTWVTEVNKLAMPGITKILIGNKSDLIGERRVSYEEGKHMANKLGLKFMESSAKDSSNVFEAFKLMTLEMANKLNNFSDKTPNKIKKGGARKPLKRSIEQKSKGCC